MISRYSFRTEFVFSNVWSRLSFYKGRLSLCAKLKPNFPIWVLRFFYHQGIVNEGLLFTRVVLPFLPEQVRLIKASSLFEQKVNFPLIHLLYVCRADDKGRWIPSRQGLAWEDCLKTAEMDSFLGCWHFLFWEMFYRPISGRLVRICCEDF